MVEMLRDIFPWPVDKKCATYISSLQEFLEYIHDPANKVWTDTISTIAKYINKVREQKV